MAVDIINDKNVAQKKKRSKTAWLGYTLSVLGAFSSASGNLFLKITDENKINVVLIRYGLQFLILLPILTGRKTDLIIKDKKMTFFVLFRGFLPPLIMMFNGFSMKYLSLGDTMAIFYTYPVFVGFFACLCLNEKCGILNIFLTVITMSGFILVAQPSFIFGELGDVTHDDGSRMIGAALALLAAIMASLATVTLRRIGSAVHFTQSMLHCGWEAVLISSVALSASQTSFLPCFESFPTILGCTTCFMLAEICRILALQYEKAGPVTLILTSQVVFSFLLQFIFLNEIPNLIGVAGAFLILTSCISFGIKNILMTVKSKK